jgi:hypothetical protein
VLYRRADEVRDCGTKTPDPCMTVRCAADTRCVAVDGHAECRPAGPFCGGIAGIACPGTGTCYDNPTDDCDPKRGGADCGGICRCEANGNCPDGSIWNGAPDVCGCVPDTTRHCVENVLCIQGSHFDSKACKCVPDQCVQTQLCIRGYVFDPKACKCVPGVTGP